MIIWLQIDQKDGVMSQLIRFCVLILVIGGLFTGCESGDDGPVTPGTTAAVPVLWGEPVQADSDLEYCLKVAKAEETECTSCVCDSCYDEMVDCYFNEGCTYIRECTFVTGCQGPQCLTECGDVMAAYVLDDTSSLDLMNELADCATSKCTACVGNQGPTQTDGPE